MIAATSSGAGHLVDALDAASDETTHRVFGNTVIRCAIQHAHTQVEDDTTYGIPLGDCNELFDHTAAHIESGRSGSPFESGVAWLPRLGDEPFHGWVWREDYPDDIFGRTFRFLIENNYGDGLWTPSDEELAALQRGEQLLRVLLPELAASALTHAHLVGIFSHAGAWKDKASSSQIRIGGTVFLARTLLRSPWIVAEHLFHEALHQKLYDFRHGHTLLDPDFGKRGAPRVRSAWNPAQLNDANQWDTHRAFAAFHVYVHLALLAQIAESRAEALSDEFGPTDGLIASSKAFSRAWYLGEQLQTTSWEVLGVAGRRLVGWLMSVLEALEPSPPPDGAHLHLVLDLYQREARKVNYVLNTAERSPETLLRILEPLVREEIACAEHALTLAGADDQLAELRRSLGGFTSADLATGFPGVRTIISRSLLDATPDGYAFAVTPGRDDPNQVIDSMVLEGSHRLHVSLEDIPDLVAEAKQRAHRLRVTISCVDEVGRLLSVLAAAVPPGARVLEVGTSVGVGTAWLADALTGRDDVELFSIERDPELVAVAAAAKWPQFVRIVAGDAREAIPRLGRFDLMFVDASPIKHGHIELAIGALAENGLMVIDDLHTDLKNFEVQKEQKDALRHFLIHHPDLRAVELDWASGVMLVSRRGDRQS